VKGIVIVTDSATSGDGQGPGGQQIPSGARGYDGFGGHIGRTSAESTPWWAPETKAPAGAPNIVVILIDDMGYSDIGPFGSEIDTPNLNRLADSGYRLSNYHTTSVCSPARAALLTGLNPHRAGYGSVANFDPGFPGLRMELADDALSLAEILRANGYATHAVGKWHLARDTNLAPGRTRDSWPLQRGFDSYYGSLEGLNSFYYPNELISDNSVVDVEEYPSDYYVTDDITDKAVSRIKSLRAHDADKPFFLYFSHIAMHGPHQAKPEDLAKYRGRYTEGWDAVRRSRFDAQLEAGFFPPGTQMAERNTEPGYDAPPWDELTEEEQLRFARYQEVYAAMVDSIDQSVGRVLDTLDELGETDNTIIVFTSDNGGTAEGGAAGTRSYFSQFVHGPVPSDWVRDVPHDEELIGSEKIGVHYPRGWGQASNTPFRFYKGQTFAGGVRVPFLLSWPAGLGRADGDTGLRKQYSYVTDITPTLLDLAGLETPSHRNGLPAQERDGVSIADVLRDAAQPTPHTEQYAEFGGHRGFYRDGWKLLSLHTDPTRVDDPQWQLFDVESDPAETTDVAHLFPEKVRELAEAWDRAAWHNTVFPILNDRKAVQRRPDERRLAEPVKILAGTPTLERYRSSVLIQYRDFTIDVATHAIAAGDEGVLVAHGDPHGGYVLYVEDGRIVFAVNSYGRVAHTSAPLGADVVGVQVRAEATESVRWNFTVTLTDTAGVTTDVATLDDQFQLVGMAPWTGISVGVDARGPVVWDLRERRGTFRFTGRLRSVTYIPGPVRVPEPVIQEVEELAEAMAD
jgi:arylsulfatase